MKYLKLFEDYDFDDEDEEDDEIYYQLEYDYDGFVDHEFVNSLSELSTYTKDYVKIGSWEYSENYPPVTILRDKYKDVLWILEKTGVAPGDNFTEDDWDYFFNNNWNEYLNISAWVKNDNIHLKESSDWDDDDDDDEPEEEDTYGRRFADKHYFTRIVNNAMPRIFNIKKAHRYIRFIKNYPEGTGITNLVNMGRKCKATFKPTTDSYAALITWLKLNDYIDLIRTDNNRTTVIPTQKTLSLTDEEISNITRHPGA